ncbi:MAG: hypothetical protein RR575_13125 [Acinetobacter sp.]
MYGWGFENEWRNRKGFSIMKDHKFINKEDLSKKIVDSILKSEEETLHSISSEEFQDIIAQHAASWAIRDVETELFLSTIDLRSPKEDCASWTPNLRDAFIFNDEEKAYVLSISIGKNLSDCEVVPLIYAVDPLYNRDDIDR